MGPGDIADVTGKPSPWEGQTGEKYCRQAGRQVVSICGSQVGKGLVVFGEGLDSPVPSRHLGRDRRIEGGALRLPWGKRLQGRSTQVLQSTDTPERLDNITYSEDRARLRGLEEGQAVAGGESAKDDFRVLH